MKYTLTLSQELFNVTPLNKTVKDSIDQEGYRELLASFYLPAICTSFFKHFTECQSGGPKFSYKAVSGFVSELSFELVGNMAKLRDEIQAEDVKDKLDSEVKGFMLRLLQLSITEYNETNGSLQKDPQAYFQISVVEAKILKSIKLEES